MVVITGHFDKFSSSSYQLQINTTTTIITFLMVALLQNSETRADQAIQHKLNAMAGAMATMMEHMAHGDDHSDLILKETEELRAAVGLENRESST